MCGLSIYICCILVSLLHWWSQWLYFLLKYDTRIARSHVLSWNRTLIPHVEDTKRRIHIYHHILYGAFFDMSVLPVLDSISRL